MTFYRRHLLIGDILVSLAAFTGMWVWNSYFGGNPILGEILHDSRGQIYSTFASIFGSLLGFLITAVSIIIGFASQERMALMAQSERYPELFRVFIHAIWGLAIATCIALVALLLDREKNPSRGYIIATFTISVFSSLRLIWCVTLLGALIEFFVKPLTKN